MGVLAERLGEVVLVAIALGIVRDFEGEVFTFGCPDTDMVRLPVLRGVGGRGGSRRGSSLSDSSSSGNTNRPLMTRDSVEVTVSSWDCATIS